MKNNPYEIVSAAAAIGLRHWPDEYIEEYNPYSGWTKRAKPVHRVGLSALGIYQPQDVGKRVKVVKGITYVEDDETFAMRTGMTFEQRYNDGLRQMEFARKKYNGEKNIWGRVIKPLVIPPNEMMSE